LHRLIDFITAKEDSEKEMWTTYMEEIKEGDKRITEAWKEDANALVVFVSRNLLIPPSVLILINLEDRSFLRSRCCFYHRKLQKLVTRYRKSDSSPSWPDFAAACRFHE